MTPHADASKTSPVAPHACWERAELRVVDDARWFWALWDEMVEDGSGFIHNRECLLKAFKADRMRAMEVHETDAMFRDKMCSKHPGFMQDTAWYRLPAFCCTSKNGGIDIIWVHTRCRGAGLGRRIVTQAGATEHGVSNVLPESLGFWAKCGVTVASLAYCPR